MISKSCDEITEKKLSNVIKSKSTGSGEIFILSKKAEKVVTNSKIE